MANSIWGPATSELQWRGFADGGRISSPGAIAPPADDPYTKLALKAVTDIGEAAWNEYTAPVNKGEIMWGDELSRFDTAIAAQETPEAIEGAKRAKRDFIRAHPNAGKEIYYRPEWTENVPDFLMPGGSRYAVPEGALNVTQANALRSNWRADPSFTPEAAPLAKKTSQVTSQVPAPTVNNAGPFPTDPEDPQIVQGWDAMNQRSIYRDKLGKMFAKLDRDIIPNTPDFLLNDKQLAEQKKRDKVMQWYKTKGYTKFANDPIAFAEFEKDPVSWYYTIGPGKTTNSTLSTNK